MAFVPLSFVGAGAIRQLPEEVRRYTPSRIALIADPALSRFGITQKAIDPLQDAGCEIELFEDVTPEPSLELAERLVAAIRERGCDLVIGFGGGSALDLAKLAAVVAANEGGVADYLNLTGTKRLSRKGLPKILIPTTSGTGSEATNIAVVSLAATKDVVAHDYLLADAAIVDPELTLTVPPRVTAATGMDALTHAVEAYLSVNANPASDALALQAVRLIGRSLRVAVSNGSNLSARADMSVASFLAGLAFFQAGVAGVHALAYPLGGQFHIPHGEANAALLPYVMNHIRSAAEDRLAVIGKELEDGNADAETDSTAINAERCVSGLFRFVRDLKLPTALTEFGIPAVAIDSLTDDACSQTRLLARSPMPLSRDDIKQIYDSTFRGMR